MNTRENYLEQLEQELQDLDTYELVLEAYEDFKRNPRAGFDECWNRWDRDNVRPDCMLDQLGPDEFDHVQIEREYLNRLERFPQIGLKAKLEAELREKGSDFTEKPRAKE